MHDEEGNLSVSNTLGFELVDECQCDLVPGVKHYAEWDDEKMERFEGLTSEELKQLEALREFAYKLVPDDQNARVAKMKLAEFIHGRGRIGRSLLHLLLSPRLHQVFGQRLSVRNAEIA